MTKINESLRCNFSGYQNETEYDAGEDNFKISHVGQRKPRLKPRVPLRRHQCCVVHPLLITVPFLMTIIIPDDIPPRSRSHYHHYRSQAQCFEPHGSVQRFGVLQVSKFKITAMIGNMFFHCIAAMIVSLPSLSHSHSSGSLTSFFSLSLSLLPFSSFLCLSSSLSLRVISTAC